MDHRDILERIFSSNAFIADREICSTRRGLLLAPLLAALPLTLSQTEALADKIDPAETQITLPDAIKWSGPSRLARVHQLKLDGRDSKKTNDGRPVRVLLHPVIMRGPATSIRTTRFRSPRGDSSGASWAEQQQPRNTRSEATSVQRGHCHCQRLVGRIGSWGERW
jgi:hypothetical protein